MKKPVNYSLKKKIWVFVVTMLMLSVMAASSGVSLYLARNNGYSGERSFFDCHMDQYVKRYADHVFLNILSSQPDSLVSGRDEADVCQDLASTNIVELVVDGTGKNPIHWKYKSSAPVSTVRCYYYTYYYDLEEKYGNGVWKPNTDEMKVYVGVDQDFPKQDELAHEAGKAMLLYHFRWCFLAAALGSAAAFILGFIYLLRAAGHKEKEIRPYWGMKVPGDLFLCAVCCLTYILCQLLYEGILYQSILPVFLVPLSLALNAILLWACLDLAVRWKCKTIFRQMLLVRLFRYIWKKLKKSTAFLKEIAQNLPMLWKTFFIYASISISLLLITLYYHNNSMRLNLEWKYLLWILLNLILFPVVVHRSLQMDQLQKAAKALAEGDLFYQVDTSKMRSDLREHGENLNHIAVGMSDAVEQRVRSERMKTELITNVSHDLKTPLTSIINYSDLIGREKCDNPQITEYVEILHRQSERLKRLIEDLVEASKASTGNLDVKLAPCEVGVVLTQIVGEYEERMLKGGLELITTKPDHPVTILADGRRLCRVFDNLMTNICKYAQTGTRVYLTLEQQGENAVILFRNTSREPLNLSAQEFMERFVRGDQSRRTEGNGLGLSIAKSLTELQKGTMDLSVDGDLFKVILSFPVAKMP